MNELYYFDQSGCRIKPSSKFKSRKTIYLMAVNLNKIISRFKSTQDRVADSITAAAGSTPFVYVHGVWFTVWIIVNVGLFGRAIIFDEFPFGLLTLIVSLEAIFLSTFVMISQNRQEKESKLRNEVSFITQNKEESEVQLIMEMLQRIAKKQDVKVRDLLERYEHINTEHALAIDNLKEK